MLTCNFVVEILGVTDSHTVVIRDLKGQPMYVGTSIQQAAEYLVTQYKTVNEQYEAAKAANNK